MKTRIVIVDDHSILRAGLRIFLNDQDDMDVVAEAGDSEEAMQAIAAARPDVVTLDLTMPGEGGLSLLKRLRREFPEVCVLVLTMHDDSEYLKAALAAGAAGYVTKTADEAEVLAAIRAIRQGRTHFSLSMHSALGGPHLGAATESSGGRLSSDPSPLSEREQEVLAMVARGLTNQQIAEALFLSVKTIETYRSRLMVKLGLQSRAELVTYALRTGILSTAATASRQVCQAFPAPSP
jgi:two-component system, NarL family, response regulator NreC